MHQPQTKKKKAFTLVELIIVITILSILATIAFISFQGYTKDTRDSVRLTDIKSIYDGLSIYKVQTSTTLLPDDYIEIQSGTTTISYQGYAGDTVQRGINLKNGGTDPLSKNYYIYTTDVSAKKIQLMTYLETADKDVILLSKLDNLNEKITEINLINQVYSSNTDTGYYLDKKIYVYGDKIGILTDENNVPLQETTTSTGINLVTNTGNITTYFGGDVYDGGKSTSTGVILVNEINGAINNTLPCSPTTHEGYEITSLQDSQSGSFTKPLTGISNGSGTGTIIATCNNGELTYSEPINNINCITNYIPNLTNDGCIADVCDGNLPLNAELNGTQSLGNTWSYSTISGVCKYQCQNGYHTEDGGVSCVSNTNPLTCGGSIPQYATGTTSSTYNQTWNGSSWSSTYNWGENQAVCDFNCNSGYVWNGSSCELNNYFAGTGISGDPYRIKGIGATDTTTIATNCNYYNLNATTNSSGNSRGTGTCGNGSQECLANGVYLIDPDSNGGVNAYKIYCEMNQSGGGWTLVLNGNINSTGNYSSSRYVGYNFLELTDNLDLTGINKSVALDKIFNFSQILFYNPQTSSFTNIGNINTSYVSNFISQWDSNNSSGNNISIPLYGDYTCDSTTVRAFNHFTWSSGGSWSNGIQFCIPCSNGNILGGRWGGANIHNPGGRFWSINVCGTYYGNDADSPSSLTKMMRMFIR